MLDSQNHSEAIEHLEMAIGKRSIKVLVWNILPFKGACFLLVAVMGSLIYVFRQRRCEGGHAPC